MAPGHKHRAPTDQPLACNWCGAGAGTNLWAVQQVWPGAARAVLSVEPSRQMAALGSSVSAALARKIESGWEEEEGDGGAVAPDSRWRGRDGHGGRRRGVDAVAPYVTWAAELPRCVITSLQNMNAEGPLHCVGYARRPEGPAENNTWLFDLSGRHDWRGARESVLRSYRL